MQKVLLCFILFLQIGCASDKYYYNNAQKVELTPVETISRSTSTIDYYTTENDIKVGVTTKILVKFTDDSNLEIYLTEFTLTLVKELGTNLYLVEVENKDLTIDVANSLYEKDDVKYAHPDFLKKMIKR